MQMLSVIQPNKSHDQGRPGPYIDCYLLTVTPAAASARPEMVMVPPVLLRAKHTRRSNTGSRAYTDYGSK